MAAPITFGKYLLLDRINVGGMAEVFKAKTFGIEGFERIIAIKRILPNMADDEEFINMFVDEARIAVQLSHANIVQIYELGKIENQYYIAMEYVSGKDLRQVLDRYRKKEKTLPIPAAAYITSRICEGLDYAHRKSDPAGRPLNVIHRDVSPQNILVSFEGAVKITDFGIAKAEDRASKTQAGVLKGKFGYMSPEQVRGLEIDHRSDIFAVGILLYEMVTGKRLFIGESDFSTLERVRKAEVVPPREHNPDLSPEFEQVVMRTLARERDERYQWASELLDDLQQFTIDNNTIFNAKRMSAILREDYQSDIDAEMQRMEEYMRLPPPSAASTAEPGSGFAPGDTEKGESTMIFESDFADLENAPTQIGESVSEAKLSRIEQMQTGSLVVPAKPVGPPPKAAGPAGGGRVSVRPSQSINAGAVPSESGVPVGLLAAVGLVFIGLAGVLIYTLFSGGESTGTLMVTTEPVTENVEIVLDNEVIATTTPHYREGLKAGTYRLEARAAGYESKVFRVKIGDGAEAVVEVEFDTAVPRSDGLVRVGTDPPGASVYRGDDKVGITPFEVENVNTGKPVAFTVKLDGYRDVELKGEFGAGERMLELNASLEEENSSGTLFVTSRPTGAAVFLGKKKIGTTPYRIEDLDLEKKHSIELALDGFKSVKAVHEFNGKVDAKRSFTLERIREARPDGGRRPDAVKPAGGGKTPKPPGAGKPAKGGKCSGEGGTFSVLVVGESCSIKVGRKGGFTSPFFKQKVPTGKCPVVVSCPSGKSYSVTRTFKAGDNGKLIVMPNMLK